MWHVISSLCIWGGGRKREINEQMTKWLAELIKHRFTFWQLVVASVPTTPHCHDANRPGTRDWHSASSGVNFIPKEGAAKTRSTPSLRLQVQHLGQAGGHPSSWSHERRANPAMCFPLWGWEMWLVWTLFMIAQNYVSLRCKAETDVYHGVRSWAVAVSYRKPWKEPLNNHRCSKIHRQKCSKLKEYSSNFHYADVIFFKKLFFLFQLFVFSIKLFSMNLEHVLESVLWQEVFC